MWEIISLNPDRVKPMTYTIYICCLLAWCSALLVYGKDWLAQCKDNVTQWDIGSWCCQPDFPVGQYYKVAMSVHCHKSVPILISPQMLLGHKTTNKQNQMNIYFSFLTLLSFKHYLIKYGKFQLWTINLRYSTSPCPILVMPNARLGSEK